MTWANRKKKIITPVMRCSTQVHMPSRPRYSVPAGMVATANPSELRPGSVTPRRWSSLVVADLRVVGPTGGRPTESRRTQPHHPIHGLAALCPRPPVRSITARRRCQYLHPPLDYPSPGSSHERGEGRLRQRSGVPVARRLVAVPDL